MGAKQREFVIDVDGQEVHVPRKRVRKTRNGGVKPEIKEKFKEERSSIGPLQAKTEAQKTYLKSLADNIITVAAGHSGCGKSYCASYYAAQLLHSGKIEKVFITRPYAHLGKDYGATPGTDAEKLEMFLRPILDVLKKTLGEAKYNYYMDTKKIETAPLEKIQGRSFDESCVILCDEGQNASKPQLLSLITRIGEGVEFLAILGDPRQSINKGENALDWITSFFNRNEIANVGIVNFTESDCVRSGIVKDILIAFEKEGGFYNQM